MIIQAVRIISVILITGSILPLKAQKEDLSLSGFTREGEEVLPFTHVYLKAARLGIISGINGRFSMRVSAEHADDTLVFSHIGFEDLEIPLSTLSDREDDAFTLQESSLSLQEVVVTDKESFLEKAFEPFKNPVNTEEVFTRKALFGFLQKEQGRFTAFEEFAVTLNYTKEDGWPTEIGVSVDAQRKGFDYSKFPKISSKKQREGIQGPFYTGRSLLQLLDQKANDADLEKLELSEIYTLDGVRILVYVESSNDRYYLYHISESEGQLIKVVIQRRSGLAYWHTSKFNNSSYSNYRFSSTYTYQISYSNGMPMVGEIDSRRNTQYLNRLTGVTEVSHEDITRIKFTGPENPTDQSYKDDDLFERPLFLTPDPGFWTQSETLIDDFSLQDLEFEKSLSEQFSLSNNDLILKNVVSDSFLARSEMKMEKAEGAIDGFLASLKSNAYIPSKEIRFEWDDVDELMKYVTDTTMINRFPRNLKSKFFVPESTVGIIAMWLIESIRLNESKKKPTGWFASALPVLKDENDQNRDKETDDGRGFFVPVNTRKKQEDAAKYYMTWWEKVYGMDKSKALKTTILPREMEWF